MIKKPILILAHTVLVFSLLLVAACGKLTDVVPQSTGEITPTPPTVTSPDTIKKWIVSTVAGSGTPGAADGDTTQVQFSNAQGIVADNHGNLFVGDQGNASIRKVTYAGHVTTYASQSIGNISPDFGNIYSIAMDAQDNLYTIEYSLIRKIITPTDNYIFAGSLSVNYLDGTGTNAAFNIIGNMTIDNEGNIFLPDYDMSNNFVLRKVTPAGVVTTLTLNDNTGYSSNAAPNYYYLYAIAVDQSGNIYVTGNGNSLIKKVAPNGNVTIFAGGSTGFKDGKGKAARFNTISNMTFDASGNLWLCDGDNHAIREVTPDGTVTTIAGQGGVMGYADGDAKDALFKYPWGITIDNNGVIYIMDTGNNRVRKLEYK